MNESFEKGLCALAQGNFDEAQSCFAQSIDAHPEFFDAFAQLGALLLAQGAADAALSCFERALELHSENPLAWTNQAAALDRLGRHPEALQACDRALAIDAGCVDAYCNKGTILQHMGRPEEANRQYHAGIEQIEGEHASLFYGVATSLCGLDRRQEALAWFRKAIEFDPDHFNARCDYGIALLKLGRPEDALGEFDAALDRNRHLPVAWYGRGLALNNGQVSRTQAAQSFIRAASLGSAAAESCLEQLGVRGWKQYVSDSDPAIHIRPKVFISYTWESKEHKRWVRELAEELLHHGIDAFFDGLIPAGYVDYEEISVNEIVHRIQGCQVFVPIFTQHYLAKIGSRDGLPAKSVPTGWVFDEWQLSLTLGSQQMIETIPVLREGDPARLPRPFSAENIIDLRPGQDRAARLRRLVDYVRDERSVILAPDIEAMLDQYFSRRKRFSDGV